MTPVYFKRYLPVTAVISEQIKGRNFIFAFLFFVLKFYLHLSYVY